jgi:hypothetical protein
MDRRECERDERELAAFLTGDLSGEAARAFDKHLLSCERCWRAVRADRVAREAGYRLRAAPPAGLADRVRFAVELAAADGPSRDHRRRRVFAVGTTLTALAAALALGLLAWLLPDRTPGTPAPVAAVVQYARLLPTTANATPGTDPGAHTDRPTPVGSPLSLSVDGVRIQLSYYRLGATEVAVATADRPFPEPAGARAGGGSSGSAMTWTATVNGVSLYCPSSTTLLAAPIAVDRLITLAPSVLTG